MILDGLQEQDIIAVDRDSRTEKSGEVVARYFVQFLDDASESRSPLDHDDHHNLTWGHATQRCSRCDSQPHGCGCGPHHLIYC